MRIGTAAACALLVDCESHPRRVDAGGEQVLPVRARSQLLAGLREVQILWRSICIVSLS